MAVVTRLGLYGGPRRLYGSFAGKAEDVAPRDTVTRLGLYGATRGLYGSFAGKTEAEAPAPEVEVAVVASGGGTPRQFRSQWIPAPKKPLEEILEEVEKTIKKAKPAAKVTRARKKLAEARAATKDDYNKKVAALSKSLDQIDRDLAQQLREGLELQIQIQIYRQNLEDDNLAILLLLAA